MIRIGIVDDQELITEGLKRILDTYEDLKVVATGCNGREAISLCDSYAIDVLLMDLRMPEMNGVEALKWIKKSHEAVKVIILTTFEDEEAIIEGIAEGASGYLFKDIPYDKLAQAIREVQAGQFMMPQKVASVLAKNINRSESKKEIYAFELTERELQIAKMLEEGFTNKQIAMALYISEGTVKNYVSSLYAKTDTSSRVELVKVLGEGKTKV